jgi:hypothetical protein
MYKPNEIISIIENIKVEKDIYKVSDCINDLFEKVSIEVRFEKKYNLESIFKNRKKVKELVDEQFITIQNLIQSTELVTNNFKSFLNKLNASTVISVNELINQLKVTLSHFKTQADIFDFNNISEFHGNSPFYIIINAERIVLDFGNLICSDTDIYTIKQLYGIRRSLYLNLSNQVTKKLQSLSRKNTKKASLNISAKGKKTIAEFILAFDGDKSNYESGENYTEILLEIFGFFFDFNNSEFSKFRQEIYRNKSFVKLQKLTNSFDSLKKIYLEKI